VFAVERGFALEDAHGTITYLDEVWSDPGVRMNEGGCDPDGNGPRFDDLYLVGAGGGRLARLTWTGAFGAKFTPDGQSVIYKDTDDRFWRLALDRSTRSPIELPRVEADWDIHFAER